MPFPLLSIAQDVPQHPLSRPPQRLPGLLSNMRHSHPLISLALLAPSSFSLFILMLYGNAIQKTALQCVIFFHTNFPQGCHKLHWGNCVLPIHHRGLRSTASCFRCASGAQRAVRAVQCGRLAVGAHTSLTKPKEREWTQPKRTANAHQGLQATCFSRW